MAFAYKLAVVTPMVTGTSCKCLPDNSPCSLGLSKCEYAVNSQRPVNLDLRTIKLPLTAISSILHRITGVILFLGIAVLLYGLDKSLASEQGFAEVKECLTSPLAKFVVWGLLSGLMDHLTAGIRQFILDIGVGETLGGGKLGAQLVFIISAVLIVLMGVWIW